MKYSEFITLLQANAEVEFAQFQARLIFTKYSILGVRTPIMRKIAKMWKGKERELLSFPNEYYEVVFIKLVVISALPYEEFIKYVKDAVSLMDNWALCDCFKAKCIAQNKEHFLSILKKLYSNGEEFYQRYVLVVLLAEYIQPQYLEEVKDYIVQADTEKYYVHMAVAWLTAEILVKFFDCGVALLKENVLPMKTYNKAIQKAIESYRLSKEQKEYLRSLKIKNKK